MCLNIKGNFGCNICVNWAQSTMCTCLYNYIFTINCKDLLVHILYQMEIFNAVRNWLISFPQLSHFLITEII